MKSDWRASERRRAMIEGLVEQFAVLDDAYLARLLNG